MTTRAQQKLLDFVNYLNFSFAGRVVLDIGSSTGGFTQVALAGGAKKVIAVEKGTNQMLSFLRHDPRVELHEKTDIFDFTCPPPDVVLADVSFTSLLPILRHLQTAQLLTPATDLLIMLKPQFEASPSDLHHGIIKNEKIRRQIIKKFELSLRQANFVILDKKDNQVTGKKGNIERFYYLKSASSPS